MSIPLHTIVVVPIPMSILLYDYIEEMRPQGDPLRRGEGGVFGSVTRAVISGRGGRGVDLDQGCDHIDRETFPCLLHGHQV
jgi:hypothetical protein